MTKLMSFSAKRCAYCPRPSFSSQLATCCIAAALLRISAARRTAPHDARCTRAGARIGRPGDEHEIRAVIPARLTRAHNSDPTSRGWPRSLGVLARGARIRLLILLYYLGDAFGQKKMLGYPRDDSAGGLYRLFELTFLENTPRGIGRSEAHLAPTSTRVHEGWAAFSLPTSRITVPTPRPTSRAIRRMPMPRERSLSTAFTLAPWLCSTVRRPSCLPSARARARQVMTRSRIIARSTSAKTPSIWNMARPEGVDVSSPC